MLKQSSKLLINDHNGNVFIVYRSPNATNNPDTYSLPGADGKDVFGIIIEARTNFGLETPNFDWSYQGSVVNAENKEENHLWHLNYPVKKLSYNGDFIGGLMLLHPSQVWKYYTEAAYRLSPAMSSIMDTWQENPVVEQFFGPAPPCLHHTVNTDVFEDGRKVTSSAIIRTSTGLLWMIERSNIAGINNPGMVAFSGSNGDDLGNVVAQLYKRIGLVSAPTDWERLPRAFNPANGTTGEYKAPFVLKHIEDTMPRFQPEGHEAHKYARIGAYGLDEFLTLHAMQRLSPAAVAVINANTSLFGGLQLSA